MSNRQRPQLNQEVNIKCEALYLFYRAVLDHTLFWYNLRTKNYAL